VKERRNSLTGRKALLQDELQGKLERLSFQFGLVYDFNNV
jgi:hypothetical protein